MLADFACVYMYVCMYIYIYVCNPLCSLVQQKEN